MTNAAVSIATLAPPPPPPAPPELPAVPAAPAGLRQGGAGLGPLPPPPLKVASIPQRYLLSGAIPVALALALALVGLIVPWPAPGPQQPTIEILPEDAPRIARARQREASGAATSPKKSETRKPRLDAAEAPSIGRAFSQGAMLVGEARRQNDVWPFRLKVATFNESTGAWVGELEWVTLASLHRIEGAVLGTRAVEFKETAAIRSGSAVVGCAYHLTLDHTGRRLTGQWSCIGQWGTVWIDLSPVGRAVVESAEPSPGPRTDTAAVDPTALGTWEGTITQPELPNRPYPIVLTLTETRSGTQVGRAEYPTGGCSYSLTLIERSNRALLVRQNLESGRRCVNGTKVQLTLSEAGNLALEAFYPDGQSWARSVLTRRTLPMGWPAKYEDIYDLFRRGVEWELIGNQLYYNSIRYLTLREFLNTFTGENLAEGRITVDFGWRLDEAATRRIHGRLVALAEELQRFMPSQEHGVDRRAVHPKERRH